MSKKDDCIFCKIASGEIPTEFLYEDEQICAFKDLSPLAPVHILIIPKDHTTNLNDCGENEAQMLGHILLVAKKLAADCGVDQSGYRLVSNIGPDSGQSVMHTHFHILGGRKLSFEKQ